MPCHFTDITRIAGDGTGRLETRLDVWPPNPCKCGPLRIQTEILYTAAANPAGEVIATIQFKVNSDHYEYSELGNIILGTGYYCSFIVECEDHGLIFAWRLYMPDDPETYCDGDLWWWEQVMD